tara:strand:- start:7752 stop:8537 length:786 start_codon:yes stop_codon:yes gene_type:complete
MSNLGFRGSRGLILGFSGDNCASFHIAKALASHGSKIALTSRTSRLEELADSAKRAGSELHLGVDADDEASMRGAIEQLTSEWGALDFIVHSLVHVPSGVLARPLTELTKADFHSVVDIGVLSLIQICGMAAPLLRNSAAPRIVTLSSESSMLATPNYHVAGIGKAALESASRYLALELGSHKILCNVVSFSAMDSDGAANTIGKENIERTRSHLAKRSMTGLTCDWQHVVNGVLWMCSPMMQNITGQKIVIDGGYSASYF